MSLVEYLRVYDFVLPLIICVVIVDVKNLLLFLVGFNDFLWVVLPLHSTKKKKKKLYKLCTYELSVMRSR